MKIGKAITAMQRGEVVRRRGQSGGFRISDGTLEHQSTDKAWSRSGPYFFDNNLKYDDWVIVRKKPKAPAPRYTEDQLEPVGTVPVVGDKVVLFHGPDVGHAAVVCNITAMPPCGEGPENAKCDVPGWAPHLPAFRIGSSRVVKRPLRNVFADPRVGDVVKFRCFPVETIRYVDADMVSTWDGRRATSWSRHEGSWGLAPDFTVISRAPEEVAPTA